MKARVEIQRIVRAHTGAVLARLVRSVRDLDLAEDALQEALIAALNTWPTDGLPDRPEAWLLTSARHKAIDELRRRTLRANKADELQWLATLQQDAEGPRLDGPIRDDMLRLIFTCCHPALAPEARVALTLRVIAGLETDEIARAFLVPTPTMSQRLVRAKRKIKAAKVPYRVPNAGELRERTNEVLAVVYLIFNEGYAATQGAELVRRDLCGIAIRLGRSLTNLLPELSEVFGLLGLMLLHDARSSTRATPSGDLVLLEDQDRTRWNRKQIEEGLAVTQHALTLAKPGTYALQAAIAAVHAEAPSSADTDWRQIVGLYDLLYARNGSPVVALNRAVAVAMRDGPEAGLTLMDALAEPLDDYHLFHAARADLLRRLGHTDAAAEAYRRALGGPTNDAERRFLSARLSAMLSRTTN